MQMKVVRRRFSWLGMPADSAIVAPGQPSTTAALSDVGCQWYVEIRDTCDHNIVGRQVVEVCDVISASNRDRGL